MAEQINGSEVLRADRKALRRMQKIIRDDITPVLSKFVLCYCSNQIEHEPLSDKVHSDATKDFHNSECALNGEADLK